MAKRSRRPLTIGSFLNLKTAIIAVIILLLGWFGAALALDQRQIFLPGETSVGHELIEMSCSSCHEGFKPVSNETCNRCHEAEMSTDMHGQKKFRDPRWGDLLTRIDVLTCTSCHEEHVHMFGRGVHLAPDLCMNCHQGIIEGNLASHEGFTPDGCWTGGCHNYHDHRSISTGFLRENLELPPYLPTPVAAERVVTVQREAAPKPDLSQEFLGS
ncbi:MAG: cytochrome c3 family protein [Cyanobacteria bacterium P01_H01_bin.15]